MCAPRHIPGREVIAALHLNRSGLTAHVATVWQVHHDAVPDLVPARVPPPGAISLSARRRYGAMAARKTASRKCSEQRVAEGRIGSRHPVKPRRPPGHLAGGRRCIPDPKPGRARRGERVVSARAVGTHVAGRTSTRQMTSPPRRVPSGTTMLRWRRSIMSGSSTAFPEARCPTRPVWSRASSRNGRKSSIQSRSCPGRTASSTFTSMANWFSRKRCSATIQSPKTSCRASGTHLLDSPTPTPQTTSFSAAGASVGPMYARRIVRTERAPSRACRRASRAWQGCRTATSEAG